jgi:hypothetical protein
MNSYARGQRTTKASTRPSGPGLEKKGGHVSVSWLKVASFLLFLPPPYFPAAIITRRPHKGTPISGTAGPCNLYRFFISSLVGDVPYKLIHDAKILTFRIWPLVLQNHCEGGRV